MFVAECEVPPILVGTLFTLLLSDQTHFIPCQIALYARSKSNTEAVLGTLPLPVSSNLASSILSNH
jgi:hypothetical protein